MVCDDKCLNGKCLKENQICDGKIDCDDQSDESSCFGSGPNLQVRIVGGSASHQGRVEVKAFDYPFGGVCDDGFDLEEAHVICREAGFPLGASRALIGSVFGKGEGDILLDELNCKGNESSILSCNFDPWQTHDCSEAEWAGVDCKTKPDRKCTNKVTPSTKLDQQLLFRPKNYRNGDAILENVSN